MVLNLSQSILNIKMETKDGFLIINKDKGCTSHDCVKQIRRLLNMKKVGHAGTLDPEVTGTLPIAIGNATRFIQYLPQSKTYIGQIKLGVRTNTDDIYGKVINKKDWPKYSNKKLDKYLNNFRGIIKQTPPKVSSIHVNGERAYKKSFNNENFELEPRTVEIYELVLIKWDPMNGIIEIKIKCSAGTYIRSIARDLGEILNSEGCLLSLKRISACGFHEQKIKFWHTGRKIKFKINNFYKMSTFENKKPIKVIDKRNNLLGIGFLNNEETNISPKLVLNAK